MKVSTSSSSATTMPEPTGPILLIEDDEGLRRILARHLRGLGLAVEEAATAEVAEASLAAGVRPALVVLDLNLPGETGWELLRGPAFAAAGSPPVVVATATNVSPRRLAEFGIAGYLPKPFPLETLVDTIERLLEKDKEGATPAP
jgi:two-component system phosphate regulon response regulator OmpR